MWDVINIAVLAVPIGILSFLGCGYLAFGLTYKLVRNSLISQVSFLLIILALVLIPIFVPFRLDNNLLIALWSAWSGAVIPFGFFALLLLLVLLFG
jgi:hypothetical protein